MKLNKLLIIAVIVVVIALSGCITPNAGLKYERNNLTFYYPDDWQEANSVANGSMGAIAHKNDSQISIVIQQVPQELGSSVNETYQNNNKQISQLTGYVNIQENTSTVNNRNVLLHRYILNDQAGNQKEHIATWLKLPDGKIYVILYSAPLEKYEQEKGAYDQVVSTFDIQSANNKSFFGIDLSSIL